MIDPRHELAALLKNAVRESLPLMEALRIARDLNLESWCIGAGAVRNLVWNQLHGLCTTAAPEEVDLVFYDRFKSLEQDRELQSALNRTHSSYIWDATNQANVHLWYQQEYGESVGPFQSLEEGIASWPEYATCVGVSMSSTGEIGVTAPHGLHDLFALRLRHNPTRASHAIFMERVVSKGWLSRWPKLQVLSATANAA